MTGFQVLQNKVGSVILQALVLLWVSSPKVPVVCNHGIYSPSMNLEMEEVKEHQVPQQL